MEWGRRAVNDGDTGGIDRNAGFRPRVRLCTVEELNALSTELASLTSELNAFGLHKEAIWSGQ
jgi:hypothetical protein